eukprot:763129-Hanusia_phi.AAC.3
MEGQEEDWRGPMQDCKLDRSFHIEPHAVPQHVAEHEDSFHPLHLLLLHHREGCRELKLVGDAVSVEVLVANSDVGISGEARSGGWKMIEDRTKERMKMRMRERMKDTRRRGRRRAGKSKTLQEWKGHSKS